MSDQFRPTFPKEFAECTAEALRHLYDLPALIRSPLADALRSHDASPEHRARFLRTALLEALEVLNPGPKTPFRSASSRAYEALRLHYVEDRTVEEVARELAVSERQAYRDIRRGEADVAAVLWSRHDFSLEAPLGDAAAAARDEVGLMELRRDNVKLEDAFRDALASVAPLALQLGRQLPTAQWPLPTVRADSAALRQCLTTLLSCALQAGGGAPELRLERAPSMISVAVIASGSPERLEPSQVSLLETTAALAATMGGELIRTISGGRLTMQLRVPVAAQATLLVIDDNEGLAELFDRYLTDTCYRVIGTRDPELGMNLAEQERPDAIVLDILMPGADGWQVLSRLKEHKGTAEIPVVVCSVFNDPALAKALGAAAFIAKPVSRRDLLTEIGRAHV